MNFIRLNSKEGEQISVAVRHMVAWEQRESPDGSYVVIDMVIGSFHTSFESVAEFEARLTSGQVYTVDDEGRVTHDDDWFEDEK